jgi:hypothetical protein
MTREPASIRSLKLLSRKAPSGLEFIGAMVGGADQKEQGDRALVIMSGALVDWNLEAAISSRLAPREESEDKELFQQNGPLATMSARIKVAYALGVIDSGFRDELDHVREIRNAFAHTLTSISFTTSEVINVCNRLWIADRLAPNDENFTDARKRYTLSVGVISIVLSNYSEQPHAATRDPFLNLLKEKFPPLLP